MEYETAVTEFEKQQKTIIEHKPKIGETFTQTVVISDNVLQHLSHKDIDHFFKNAEVPFGCVLDNQEINIRKGYVRRIYIYKGEEK